MPSPAAAARGGDAWRRVHTPQAHEKVAKRRAGALAAAAAAAQGRVRVLAACSCARLALTWRAASPRRARLLWAWAAAGSRATCATRAPAGACARAARARRRQPPAAAAAARCPARARGTDAATRVRGARVSAPGGRARRAEQSTRTGKSGGGPVAVLGSTLPSSSRSTAPAGAPRPPRPRPRPNIAALGAAARGRAVAAQPGRNPPLCRSERCGPPAAAPRSTALDAVEARAARRQPWLTTTSPRTPTRRP